MNIKKIGLTALAGSLAATSAFAGELSLSGSAVLSYSDYSGTENTSVAGTITTNTALLSAAESNWGMDQEITASGSGELDNGWTVSLSHALGASGSGSTTSSITIDMGDAGSLTYADQDAQGGLKSLDDIVPTAWEEATDGTINEVQAAMGSGPGFRYDATIAGAKVGIQYSDALSGAANVNDGGVSTSGTDNGSSSSIGVQYPVGDSGLMVYGGMGTVSQADGKDIDHDTIGVKYTFGALSVGAQVNDQDDADASGTDLETTIMGISYMINENLSVSYGSHSTSKAGSPDQEIDSIQAAYSMGGIAVKLQNSQGDNMRNTAGKTSEKTEVAVSFAF
jgi:outer membrane protein OmpU